MVRPGESFKKVFEDDLDRPIAIATISTRTADEIGMSSIADKRSCSYRSFHASTATE